MGTDKHNLLFSRIIDQALPGLSDKLSARKTEKSVITRLKQGTEGLMADYPGLGYPDAEMLHNRLAVAIHAVARKQRELRQISEFRSPREEKGLKALTRQLTYEDQFSPNWAGNTLPDAIDSGHGAVAYLYDLLAFVEIAIEPKGDSDKAITLKQRRPDIYNILLNEENVNGNISKIKIINQIISTAISQQEKSEDPEKLMLNVRYPYRFPFENYMNQIYAVLDEYDLSIGDIKRCCDPQAPYFTQPGLHGTNSDSALWLDSHLGPGLREILLAVPQVKNSKEEDNTSYFKQNFGIEQFTDLLNSTVFCQQLKLERSDLELLFSCGEYVPHLSPNVDPKTITGYETELGREVSPAVYGSVFINNNVSPAIKTDSNISDNHTFENMDESRCERIERFLRLSRALDLPYNELDTLLTSVIRAEKNQADKGLTITGNTLRAIGLFVSLNRKLKCTVSQFSVLYDGISIYSQGKNISDFDRLFNNDDRFNYRFILDDKKMEERDINRICSVFGINYDTFSYLALLTREVLGLDVLTRSRNVISAIYRPVVLADLLKIKPLELLALLKSMNSDAQFDRLFTGIPENRVYRVFEQADITSAISALVSIHAWRTENKLSVAQIFNWITPAIVDEQEDNTERELFRQIKQNTENMLFSNEILHLAGVPKDIEWVSLLHVLINDQGIVKDTDDGLDWESYKGYALGIITPVVRKELVNAAPEEQDNVINTILSVLLEKRSAQWKSVSGLLEGYLGNKTDSIIPALYWCGSNTSDFLKNILDIPDDNMLSADGNKIMRLLSSLRRYSDIISHFRLEPAMMSQLLSHDNNQLWYEMKTEKPDLQLLYRLSVYRKLIDDGKQPAEKLLNYLSLINSLPIDSRSDEIRLYRDQALNKLSLFMGWSINELLIAAQYVAPENAIIRTLPQILLVKQIHSVCLKTGMSARSIISLFNLNEDSKSSLYQSVADQVMESLAPQDVSLYSNDESSQGDLTVSVSAGKTTLLVYSESQQEQQVAEDETRLTVTLQTLESTPLEGIPVLWEKISDQGELSGTESITDKSGRASMILKAGQQQGVALIKAHYGVKNIPLPLIRIDCDISTLGTTGIETVPEHPVDIPADGKAQVEITTFFRDKYNNPGIDKNIRWETTGGRFIYKDGITDDHGNCHAILVSDEPADVTVRVFYEDIPEEYTEVDISFISA
ncbi:TPA: Ig-like domain-containing protein [Morganella morganii]|nr:Ig-like domain-containing protein [Morganella morganii]